MTASNYVYQLYYSSSAFTRSCINFFHHQNDFSISLHHITSQFSDLFHFSASSIHFFNDHEVYFFNSHTMNCIFFICMMTQRAWIAATLQSITISVIIQRDIHTYFCTKKSKRLSRTLEWFEQQRFENEDSVYASEQFLELSVEMTFLKSNSSRFFDSVLFFVMRSLWQFNVIK